MNQALKITVIELTHPPAGITKDDVFGRWLEDADGMAW